MRSLCYPTILIADDDCMCTLIRWVLISMGDLQPYAIVATSSPHEVFTQCRRGPVALLIIDDQLGMLPGVQIIDTLKAQSPATATILMTAATPADADMLTRAHQITGSLRKPFRVAALTTLCRHALSVWQAQHVGV